MPKVSAARREMSRQRLIDATRRVVLRQGTDAATARAILAEAGMATGSLYTYFASKEELFEAAAEQVIAESFTLQAAAAPDDTASNLLLPFVTGLLAEPDGSPALTYFRGRLTSDPDVRAANAEFNRYMVRTFTPLVEKAQDEGVVRADLDGEALTELFDLIVDGMNRRAVTQSFVTSFERVGRAALALLVAGALAEGDTPG